MRTSTSSATQFMVLFFTLTGWMLLAQKTYCQSAISVERFTKLENDMTAKITSPIYDRNNDLTALLKIVTTADGFDFDAGSLGVVKVEYKVGEIWVYIPEGSRVITIKHPHFTLLRNYAYPIPIEGGVVYEMRLAHGELMTFVKEPELLSEFVVIDSEPQGADVYLNGVAVGTTPFHALKPEGQFEWRVEHELYKGQSGQFNLKAGNKEELTIKLKPNFGSVKVASSPESGARISLNGIDQNKQTPYLIERLPVGTHTISLRHEWYESQQVTVEVKAEEHQDVDVILNPTYALLDIKTDVDADILINGKKVGKGFLQDRLKPGVYALEVRKPSHTTEEKQVVLKPGDELTETLMPRPIYGVLKVLSEPIGANVYVNGIEKGRTPIILRDLLIGTHDLRIVKEGAGEALLNAQVIEKEASEISVNLNDELLKLSYNEREKRLKQLEEERERINSAKEEHQYKLTVINHLEANMVTIEGGSFVMGCTSDQFRQCDPDERPTRRAFISSYSMLKYEVSQAEYLAVMGVNPSVNKCPECPVENVSWSDAQRFVEELNKLTGKQFGLPTEEEWEYAARGGNRAKPTLFSGSNQPAQVAVFDVTQPSKRATKSPNELGLFDLSGNVWEWCSTVYFDKSRIGRKATSPTWNARSRVLKGGCFENEVMYLRTANRNFADLDARSNGIGFRVVLRD